MVTTATSNLLGWARSLQAIAQSGLAYGDLPAYDRERYEQVRRIAAEMLAHRSGTDADGLEALFARESGHATPKLDVRGAVFADDRILLVQERHDRGWSLPGGWVDVGESPSEAVTREILEESGHPTRAVKLLALYDRDRHGYPPHPWHIWKAVFLCEPAGGAPRPLGSETLDARFFGRAELPELRFSRATQVQIERCFEHRDHPEWPTDFD